MRIRKRLKSLMPPPDLSSPSPPSMATAGAAPSVAAAGGGKVIAAAAAAAAAAAGEGGGGGEVHGSGGDSGDGGGAGGEGRGLHPNGDLPAKHSHGCTTKPISPLPFHLPPPAAAAAVGEERGDLHPPGGHGRKMPKREQDGDQNVGDGDAHRRCNTDAKSSAIATAPKSSGAQVPEELSLGQGGLKTTLPSGVLASAETMASWIDGESGFPQKKRRGCYRARGTISSWVEDVVSTVDAEKEMKPRPRKARRRGAASSSASAIIAAAGAALGSVAVGGSGAPTVAGAGAGAPKKCDDLVVKEEGGDATSAAAAAALLVDGNRGGGNGKKRRSPAVLMEGSRCSRVNGRGWRCCQQTLVGYSLCEHHLGKGRLRSMSSVRCNVRARKKESVHGAAPSPPSPSQQQHQQSSGYGEDEEENPGKRRRKKIGMVKARSISSLLHQPDNSTVPTAMAAPEPSSSPSPASAYTDTMTAAAAAPPHGSNIVVA